MISLVEYESKYLNDVRDLLTELERYIVGIDKDHLDQVHEEYWEKMALVDLKELEENDGICYLAKEDDKVVGLIMGCIISYDDNDYLDYKCPKSGDITELIVTSKVRSKGVGKMLMEKLEDYFKSKGCLYIHVDVFAYNEIGINFYNKCGYHPRMHNFIKKI